MEKIDGVLKPIDIDVDTWMDYGNGPEDKITRDSRKRNTSLLYRPFFGEK